MCYLWQLKEVPISESSGATEEAAQRGGGVTSLEISKSRLDVVLGTLLWVALIELGLEQMLPELPANFNRSVIQ